MRNGETVRFRTTPRQWFALALVAFVVVPAAMFGLVLAVAWIAVEVLFAKALAGNQLLTGGLYQTILQIVAVAYAAVLTLRVSRKLLARGRKGIDIDGLGIRPAERKAVHLTPWAGITDIRTKRSLLRHRIVVRTDRGATWRLPVPYSGYLLARDPDFSTKVTTLREMWADHRQGLEADSGTPSSRPDRAPDRAYEPSAVPDSPYEPSVPPYGAYEPRHLRE